MRFLALFVFALFIVYALAARWYFVCEIRQLCEEEPQNTRLQTLQLREGETVLLDGYDQFVFDSLLIAPQLNANNEQFLDTVAAILKANTEKNMTITAFYRESERDVKSGYFENLGVARGDEVRKLLLKRGLDENRITIGYGESQDASLSEPLLFELYANDIPGEYNKESFTFINNTFKDDNFAFDSDEFRPGEAFLLYADSVKTYLELNDDKSLRIIGHTDAVGSSKYNANLGMRRAKSAMEYFRELGVTSEIKIDSRGEKEPVATNDTENGRQRNRRVNFRIE
jgi:outer membrane protein OmpA-like peptidoglycan-associated protein